MAHADINSESHYCWNFPDMPVKNTTEAGGAVWDTGLASERQRPGGAINSSGATSPGHGPARQESVAWGEARAGNERGHTRGLDMDKRGDHMVHYAVAAVVLACLVAAVRAVPQEGYNYQAPSGQGSPLPGSGSGQFPSGSGQFPSGSGQFPSGSGQFPSGSGQDQYPSAPAQYNFKWDVNDSPSGNFYGHQEQREGANTQGRYYVQLPDGRRLVVEYYADSTGYHPTISYEGEAQFPSGPSQGAGQGYQGGSGPNQGFPQGGPGPNQGYPQGGSGPNQGFPQGGSGPNQGFPQGGSGPDPNLGPNQSYLPPSK
nr:pro-resilin-like [Penaeus vannamei]